MKYIIALEVEAENLHEADHIAEAVHDTVNYRDDVGDGTPRFAIAFVMDSDTVNADLQGASK